MVVRISVRPIFFLPGLSDSGDVRAQAVGVRQCADKVQVHGTEGSHCTISTAAEYQVLGDGQRRGHTSLRKETEK